MTLRKNLAIATLMLTGAVRAHAGWYVVDNYEGSLGNWPVHLSLQQYDSYGSGINIKGSYYYDKYRAPIPLYGKRTADTLKLCEIHGDKEYDRVLLQGTKQEFNPQNCPFSLTYNGDKLSGQWQHSDKHYDVTLTHTASLNNTEEERISGNGVDIPFWGQTASHSFIGHYKTSAEGIVINTISVVNKKTGNTDQILKPQQQACQFGFFMTAIYQNIESDNTAQRFWLNCYSQREDITVDYHLDKNLQRYVITE